MRKILQQDLARILTEKYNLTIRTKHKIIDKLSNEAHLKN
jgi:hypothetical protein